MGSWVLYLNVAAGGTLLALLAAILLDWRRRRRIWIEAPERLAEPGPQYRVLRNVAVAVGLLTGPLAAQMHTSPGAPSAVLLAALGCLIAGHLRSDGITGIVGLALLAETVVLAVVSWMHAGWEGVVLGGALAARYILWLSRFWEQQRDAGTAFTTTGRLVPAAFAVALVVGLLPIGATAWRMLSAATPPAASVWTVLDTVACLALGVAFLRATAGRRLIGRVWGGGLVLTAAWIGLRIL